MTDADAVEIADLDSALERIQEGAHTATDLDLLRRAYRANQITIASGQRAVAIGGSADGSVIVTGDGTTVVVQGLTAETLRTALAPEPRLDPRERENRRRMLSRVRRTWIDGYLADSLHETGLHALDLEERPDAVPDSWIEVMQQQPGRVARTFPPGTAIVHVYDDVDSELLILGEPGSGKTTLLLELTRALLDRADRDEMLPIPVVFPLAPWATRRSPLVEWLVDELNLRYDVPRSIGAAWLADDRILPMLDGLDEVAIEHRPACSAAINVFRETRARRLPGLAVTCRIREWEALRTRPRVRGAVLVQPLRPEQIEVYLAHLPEESTGLRAALAADPALRELAASPLFLSIMNLAYQGNPADALPASHTLDERREQLLGSYVEAMFARRGKAARYSRQHTLQWLGWVANALDRQAQTTLYLESLQPDWLATSAERRWYAAVDRLGSAFLVGCVLGLLVRVLTGEWDAALLLGAPCGFVAGLLGGQRAPHAGLHRGGWPINARSVSSGLAVGVLSAVAIGVLTRGVLPLLGAIEFGLVIGLTTFGLVYALSAKSRADTRTLVRHGIARALICGAVGAGLGALIGFAILALKVESPWQVARALAITFARDGPVAAFELSASIGTFGGFGLVYGLTIGLLGVVVTSLRGQPGLSTEDARHGRRSAAFDVAGSALAIGGLTGGVVGLFLAQAYEFGIVGGMLGGLVGGVAGGPGIGARRVALVEPMHWSTPTAVRAGLQGLLFGLVWGTLVVGIVLGFFGWVTPTSLVLGSLGLQSAGKLEDVLNLAAAAAIASGIQQGLLFALVWGILRGLDVGEVEARPVPGQGLRRSARRAVAMGVGSWAAAAVLGSAFVLLSGVVPLFADTWTGIVGSLLLAMPFGVGAALAHGGYACLSHLGIRVVLWRTNALPSDTVRFLDYATERIFLRRVGGGYIFVHRLLQEYFATLAPRNGVSDADQPYVGGSSV